MTNQQELKQKYPKLNILGDYPDGTVIVFDSKQCEELLGIIYALAMECGFILNDPCFELPEHYDFRKQLFDYLSTKVETI
jgi:hypothetical protein